jgi:hypothetical protein
VLCGAAISTDEMDRWWLVPNVMDVITHEHEAQKGIFERAFKLQDARAVKAWELCDHAATQACFGSPRNAAGRATTFWVAVYTYCHIVLERTLIGSA